MTDIGPVVVFDGYCNLCNGWVSFIMARDARRRFRYATLQGATGQSILRRAAPLQPAGESIALVEGDRVETRSTAALNILGKLGFPWPLFRVFLLVPLPVRDAVYDFVARNRYRWFGRRSTCRVPTDEERTLFLD